MHSLAQRSTSLPPFMMLAEAEVYKLLLMAASSVEVSTNCRTTSRCTSPRNLPQLSAFTSEHVEQRSYATLVKIASLSGLPAQAHPGTGQVVGTGSAGCTALPEGTGPAVASGHCFVPGRRWASGRAHGSCTHQPVNGLSGSTRREWHDQGWQWGLESRLILAASQLTCPCSMG